MRKIKKKAGLIGDVAIIGVTVILLLILIFGAVTLSIPDTVPFFGNVTNQSWGFTKW